MTLMRSASLRSTPSRLSRPTALCTTAEPPASETPRRTKPLAATGKLLACCNGCPCHRHLCCVVWAFFSYIAALSLLFGPSDACCHVSWVGSNAVLHSLGQLCIHCESATCLCASSKARAWSSSSRPASKVTNLNGHGLFSVAIVIPLGLSQSSPGMISQTHNEALQHAAACAQLAFLTLSVAVPRPLQLSLDCLTLCVRLPYLLSFSLGSLIVRARLPYLVCRHSVDVSRSGSGLLRSNSRYRDSSLYAPAHSFRAAQPRHYRQCMLCVEQSVLCLAMSAA